MKTMKPTVDKTEQKTCDCPHCTYKQEVEAQIKLLNKNQRAFFTTLFDNYLQVCEQLQDFMEDEAEGNEEELEDADSPYYNGGEPIVYH